MASESGRTESSPVADSSPSAGGHPYASEKRVATPNAEPGRATQAEAVERNRAEGITRIAAGGVGSTAATGFTEAAQRVEPTDHQVGPGGRAYGVPAPASTTADDATRGRAHHGLGLRNHDGGCDTLPAWQTGGQLSGTDPKRAQFEQ